MSKGWHGNSIGHSLAARGIKIKNTQTCYSIPAKAILLNKNNITVLRANKNNLKNLSLSIPLGKMVVVVGPSGSGKSTLVHDEIYQSIKSDNVYLISQRESMNKDILKELKSFKGGKGSILIVDEPTAGLDEKQSKQISDILNKIVGSGVSVIAVEHSREIITNADHVIEFSGSGEKGGIVTFKGPINDFKKSNTLTSKVVFDKVKGAKQVTFDDLEKIKGKKVVLNNVKFDSIKNEDLVLPINKLSCVTSNSDIDKSDVLEAFHSALFKGKNAFEFRKRLGSDEWHRENVKGKQNIRKSYFVDQKPIGNNPTSTLSTFMNFSKNIKEGKIPVNKANNMTVDQASKAYSDSKVISTRLTLLKDIGLGYVKLGQQSKTFSGGEAQRIRLAKVLTKVSGDRSIYMLDNPSRGLHLSEIPKMAKSLKKIVDKNNTVLIADNKIDFRKHCDFNIKV